MDLEIAVITTYILYENSCAPLKSSWDAFQQLWAWILQCLRAFWSLFNLWASSAPWPWAPGSPGGGRKLPFLLITDCCWSRRALLHVLYFVPYRLDKHGINHVPACPVSPAKAEPPPHCYTCYNPFPLHPVLYQQLATAWPRPASRRS